MASADNIAELRRLVNEMDDTEPYTDAALNSRIDSAGGDLRVVAGDIWTEKASNYAELVDVTEGSSSRKLGSLYSQALAMAKTFGAVDDAPTTSTRHSRTRQIVRP